MEVRTQLLEKVQTIHSRQFDVGNQRVRLVSREFGKNFLRGAYSKDVVTPALEQLLVPLPRVVLVLDDEHAVLAFQGFDGPYSRTRFFPHGSQPLLGFLLVNRSSSSFAEPFDSSKPPRRCQAAHFV